MGAGSSRCSPPRRCAAQGPPRLELGFLCLIPLGRCLLLFLAFFALMFLSTDFKLCRRNSLVLAHRHLSAQHPGHGEEGFLQDLLLPAGFNFPAELDRQVEKEARAFHGGNCVAKVGEIMTQFPLSSLSRRN